MNHLRLYFTGVNWERERVGLLSVQGGFWNWFGLHTCDKRIWSWGEARTGRTCANYWQFCGEADFMGTDKELPHFRPTLSGVPPFWEQLTSTD